MIRDKARMRRAVDRVIDWHPEQITLAHSKLISANGEEALRAAYTWLKP
jgi:hypothetical protein